MRVLLLHRDLAYDGGVAQCFLQYAQRHDGSKVQLYVGALDRAETCLSSALESLGVPTYLCGGSYLGATRRLRQILTAEHIEVVAATSFRAYVAAKAAASGLPCRVMFWIHSIPLVIEGLLRRSIFRLLARRDTLVFVSDAVRRAHEFSAHVGASEVVYNGVVDPRGVAELAPYPREVRRGLGIPADALVVGNIAELVAWKNHDVLIEAFARLSQARSDAYLLLVGDGERLRAMLELAAERGVRERVVATGACVDARKLLGLMDIYAHPANGEGFGLAVAEAMLAGLPIVAARAGALPELVAEGRNGILVEPNCSHSLADALDRLAADPETRRRLGGQARTDGLERFAPERYARRLTQVLLAERAGQAYSEAALAAH